MPFLGRRAGSARQMLDDDVVGVPSHRVVDLCEALGRERSFAVGAARVEVDYRSTRLFCGRCGPSNFLR